MTASPARHYILIANARSGSGGDTAVDAVAAALRGAGCVVDLRIAPAAGTLADLAAAACDRRPDAVLACGGDGTVNAVAAALIGSDVPLGIVPLGTFNYVARQYGIPEAPEALAAALRASRPQPVGVGRINGRPFLNNASLGLYTDIIEARERHKAQWGRYRLVALLSALVTTLRRRARLPLRITDAAGRVRYVGRASLVFFGVNPRQFEDAGLAPLAAAVRQGALGMVLARSVSASRLVPMLFGAATGRLARLDEIEPDSDTAFRIELRRGRRLRVVIDGETLRLKPPLSVDYQPAALRLLVPAVDAD